MDIFRVVTGDMRGNPVLRPGNKKRVSSFSSEAFVIEESFPCIVDHSNSFSNPAFSRSKDDLVTFSSPLERLSDDKDPCTSTAYGHLSPEHFDNSFHSECFNRKGNGMDNGGQMGINNIVDTLELDEPETFKARMEDAMSEIVAVANCLPAQLDKTFPEEKKTLQELAEEWSTRKAYMKTKEKNRDAEIVEEPEENLVHHSVYYSTSSPYHGMSDEEYKFKKKLEARLRYRQEEVCIKKTPDTQPLIKLCQIASM